MATEITTLIIKADSSEIRKADKDLDNLEKSAGRAERAKESLKKGAVALAAGLALVSAAALAVTSAMVKMQMSSIDALAKVADRLGIATEQLAGLHLAGDLAGVSIDSLDNALQFLANNSSEAAKGIGTAKDAFRDLNIDAQEFMTLSPDQQMRVLADRMKDVATQGEKIQIARDLFGRSGSEMVNLLDGGSAALDEATKRAIAYGTALSRIDAAKVEAANDAITEAKTAFEGMAATLTVQLAPYFKAVADQISGASLEANGFKDSIINAVEFGAKAAGKLADVFWGIRLTMKLVEIGTLATREAFLALQGPSTELAVATFNLIEANQEMDELLAHKPSEDLANFFLQIKAGAHEAALEIARAAEARNKLGGGGGGGPAFVSAEGSSADEYEMRLEEEARYQEYLRNIKAAAAEEEIANAQAQNEKLWELAYADQETQIATNEAKLEEERRYQEYLKGIRESAANDEIILAKKRDQIILLGREKFFSDLAGLMNTSNKKMFEIGKAAAIAQAVIKGHEAIMSAYAAGMATTGPHAPLVAAAYMAAAAAQTANLIGNIASSSFGGGGGPGTSIGQGSSGYTQDGYFSSAPANDSTNNVLIELTQAIQALQGIPAGQVVTMGISQAGGLLAVTSDNDVSQLAAEITGSVYV